MSSAYTKITFDDSAYGITAKKLNLLTDDLSAAIAAGGGGTGTGDMTKAVYDNDANGVVDTCDSLAWSKLTGVPTTFPPGAHQASHVSGTDQIPSASTSVRGLMPQANGNPNAFYGSDGTQKQVAYTMLSGSQPGPVAHAASHLTAGSDPIALATSVLAGLCPAVDNTTIQVVTSKLSCVALSWTAITGKPATFPPDSTAMLKSVYDTNADNIVDHAALADSAPWTGITGKPATFPPSAHAASHLDNGADAIAIVTTTRTGLAPKLSGNAATYLDGTGAYSAPSGSAVVPAGAVMSYAGASAPSGWLLCDGSAQSRTTFAALYAALGGASSPWGQGDGSTTFNLPDARGRTGIGAGQGTGLTNRALAATGGEETHQLTIAELATHFHVVFGSGLAVAAGGVSCDQLSAATGNGNVNTASTGSGTAHNTMQPFIAFNVIIKT